MVPAGPGEAAAARLAAGWPGRMAAGGVGPLPSRACTGRTRRCRAAACRTWCGPPRLADDRDASAHACTFHLTNQGDLKVPTNGEAYSTAQVAEILGIGTDTLHRWLKQKRVVAPDLLLVGGVKVRLWSEAQLSAAKNYKADHYLGQGRSQEEKEATQVKQRDAPAFEHQRAPDHHHPLGESNDGCKRSYPFLIFPAQLSSQLSCFALYLLLSLPLSLLLAENL